jgi:hypothetical protein
MVLMAEVEEGSGGTHLSARGGERGQGAAGLVSGRVGLVRPNRPNSVGFSFFFLFYFPFSNSHISFEP